MVLLGRDLSPEPPTTRRTSLTSMETISKQASGAIDHDHTTDSKTQQRASAMPDNLKVDYLELPGSNFDALEKFYSSVFGWHFTDYGPDYRSFSDDKVDGGFYQSDLASRVENGSTLVVLFADDLEDVEAKVKANGGEILREIFSFPGGRRFHFADPHGNELAVWSH